MQIQNHAPRVRQTAIRPALPNFSGKHKYEKLPNEKTARKTESSGLHILPLVLVTLIGTALAAGPNKIIKTIQLLRFKQLLKQEPEELATQYPPGLAGDTALHKRLRLLIQSGDVPTLRQTMTQARVQTLDLNQGKHISYHSSAIDKALKQLKGSPDKQEAILNLLTQHPKYHPALQHTEIHAFNNVPKTRRTLLYWAIEQNRPHLVKTLLDHPKMELGSVLNARNGQPGLQYMRNQAIAKDIQQWIRQKQQGS